MILPSTGCWILRWAKEGVRAAGEGGLPCQMGRPRQCLHTDLEGLRDTKPEPKRVMPWEDRSGRGVNVTAAALVVWERGMSGVTEAKFSSKKGARPEGLVCCMDLDFTWSEMGLRGGGWE